MAPAGSQQASNFLSRKPGHLLFWFIEQADVRKWVRVSNLPKTYQFVKYGT